MENAARFTLTSPYNVPPQQLQPLILHPTGQSLPHVRAGGRGIGFERRGWFEVLLTVAWDPHDDRGHRFAHTSITDHHPLHSEAIEAAVLIKISGGRQLLRGNTVFEPGSIDTIALEVWHDSPNAVVVREASLDVRPLD